MMRDENKFSSLYEKSTSSSSQVRYRRRDLPFFELLEYIKDQIGFYCFESGDREQAEEIAMIISEVIKLPDHASVRIGRNDLKAEMVAEIYDYVTYDHVLHVIDRYSHVTYEIKHTKTYLRTALYNAVFELKSKVKNQVYTDMPWLARK